MFLLQLPLLLKFQFGGCSHSQPQFLRVYLERHQKVTETASMRDSPLMLEVP